MHLPSVSGAAAVTRTVAWARRGWPWLLVSLLLVSISLATQWQLVGSMSTDLGVYSDEPAHYVTGLMVLDFVKDGLGSSPLAFAEAFYNRFPKVALGNWPPGFYLLQLP